ncbi:Alpha/beta hydrolase family protein [Roseicitreum antarcticum]|uniref:Alpha/beta hydrolase family protein n=2 Tax=Roseicitreum antarcticum TaxID=564137 RepID=A0A1H3BU38_9RHOB|nr:Alpha/beta hydrolase family protein [Roseicitreum antarcticum]
MPELPDLSDEYANAAHIPGGADFLPRWTVQAAAFRDALGDRAVLGQPYGPGPRDWFDLFMPAARARGTLVFIHGGYWRAFDPRLWSAFASGALARGWAVAMPCHTLAPDARLSAITTQIARAVDAIALVQPGPLVLTGHSAGGHLVARLACTDVALAAAPRVARVLPISPLSDLRPLMQCDFNADLRLDAAEAARESPALRTPRAGIDAHVWVGSAERPAFRDQARWLGTAWNAPVTEDPGRHHFNVIDGLADPGSALLRAALAGL